MALYALNHATFKSAGRQFVQVGASSGFTVSTSKTKGLAMGSVLSDDIASSVEVKGGVIELVKYFTYLGSTLSADGETAHEVDCRIAKAFGSLRLSIFTNNTLSFGTIRELFTMW